MLHAQLRLAGRATWHVARAASRSTILVVQLICQWSSALEYYFTKF
jgi:hypothetical protein